MTKDEARQKFIADTRNTPMGELGAIQAWLEVSQEEIFTKLFSGRRLDNFSKNMAIALIKAHIKDGYLADVSIDGHIMKVRGDFAGHKDVFNSILGLALSHDKRKDGASLVIDLFKEIV